MCSIGGILLTDKRKKISSADQIRAVALLHSLQSRGRQAWGVYLKKSRQNFNLDCGEPDESLNGELFKIPGSVEEYFNADNKIDLRDMTMFLAHTRQMTDGDPKVNINNHPFSTENFVLSHNGKISNKKKLLSDIGIETDIECDSYAIIATIQHYYNENGGKVADAIVSTTKDLEGSYACWLYHKDTETVYLFRHSNPIHYIYDNDSKTFTFASTHTQITESSGGRLKYKDTEEVPEHCVVKVGNTELVTVKKFKPNYYRQSGYDYGCDNSFRGNRSSTRDPPSITKIDKHLVKLYEIFEEYEEDTEIRTVIALTGNTCIILVEPKELVERLDAAGFSQYKSKYKLYDSEFYKYEVKPSERLTELVPKLTGESDDELTDNVDTLSSNKIEELFWSVIFDVTESFGIKCECDTDTNTMTFEVESLDIIEGPLADALEKQGLVFSNKSKSFSHPLDDFHKKKWLNIINYMDENGG